jgi:hypothetical protein
MGGFDGNRELAIEMYPRGSSPPSNCPGQYRTTIEDYNGGIFLGCWDSKTN